MGFKKAKREQIYPKVALIGASGSGKSFSALRIATGYIKRLGGDKEIYYIDSEGGRGKYYADKFDYNYTEISEPYTPEKYIATIQEALDSGNCGVLIVDSITHEWSGKGGILEQHSNMPGNSYTNWAKLTPRHNKFVDKILMSPTFVISTVRGKDEYVLESNEKGKQVPKKVGLGGETRGNFEYEMTIAFNIDQSNHVATASKDNTELFDNVFDVLTEEAGSKIYDWANSGVARTVQKKEATYKKSEELKDTEATSTTLEDVISQIDTVAREKAKKDKKKTFDTIKSIHTNANYNSIKDIETAKKVLSALQSLKL